MSFGSKLKAIKTMDIRALAPIAFYGVVGILFLVLLPFANFPPHIGLTGIMSLITAYGLFTKRSWAKWLVIALFFVATTISLYTLYYITFSNWIVSISMIAYAVLTWVFTVRTLLKGKSSETEA
jgi:SNF family Na+-dependent transporter